MITRQTLWACLFYQTVLQKNWTCWVFFLFWTNWTPDSVPYDSQTSEDARCSVIDQKSGGANFLHVQEFYQYFLYTCYTIYIDKYTENGLIPDEHFNYSWKCFTILSVSLEKENILMEQNITFLHFYMEISHDMWKMLKGGWSFHYLPRILVERTDLGFFLVMCNTLGLSFFYWTVKNWLWAHFKL